MFDQFYCKSTEMIGVKALGNYSDSIWINNLSILLLGNLNNPHFYDFGIFEPKPKPQNQLFLSLETPGHLNKIKKIPKLFQRYYFYTYWTFEPPKSDYTRQ